MKSDMVILSISKILELLDVCAICKPPMLNVQTLTPVPNLEFFLGFPSNTKRYIVFDLTHHDIKVSRNLLSMKIFFLAALILIVLLLTMLIYVFLLTNHTTLLLINVIMNLVKLFLVMIPVNKLIIQLSLK